jgi:2-methylisocitrate lyase-like PEP mutase family enzyme
MKVTQVEKAERFKALHEGAGAFIIPNPWDVGSARLLEGMGFAALATTSSGFANTLGRMDGMVTLAEKLAHCQTICAATHIPVSADLENCFAHEPDKAAETIRLAAEAGVVGGSIEDWSGEEIYGFNQAVERVQAAVEAARSLDFPFILTARAENLLHGRIDMGDTIRRLQAFEAAGADVLYAPGLRTLEQVQAVTSAVSKPINVLAVMLPGVTLAQLAEAGAKRLSIGGALARAALAPVLRAGKEMMEQGSFGWTRDLAANEEIRTLLTGLGTIVSASGNG